MGRSMSDRYDDMSTADLLREVCRKLDRIEKQGAPTVVSSHRGVPVVNRGPAERVLTDKQTKALAHLVRR